MNNAIAKLPPIRIKKLLRKYDLKPKKSLGQNFLVQERALRKIVSAAELSPEDIVLEIGPGIGSLTRYLAIHSGKVIAVELDRDLIPPLKEITAPYPGIKIVQGDILDIDIPALMQLQSEVDGYVVVANIPYNITSTLIRRLLEAKTKPKRIVLTIQKEVAIRICSSPPKMSLLALSVQVYGKPQIIDHIPAVAFYPTPKVDSAIICIPLYPTPLVPTDDIDTFFQLTKAGFSQRRKNLRNALSAGLRKTKEEVVTLLTSTNIDPRRRAETLSIEEWKKLTIKYAESEASALKFDH
jgi:16S rRNA (adenine1518-N6/adenine1519-N6)-dimethyltransferase